MALAAVLGADACEIYTDIEGVYTTDPPIVPSTTLQSVGPVPASDILPQAPG